MPSGPDGAGRRACLTTLEITADLIGRLEVDRWVYYCVDDLSAWPSLDGAVMKQMERRLAERVDAVIAASEPLRHRIEGMGRPATLLTHGIDLDHWSPGRGPSRWNRVAVSSRG